MEWHGDPISLLDYRSPMEEFFVKVLPRKRCEAAFTKKYGIGIHKQAADGSVSVRNHGSGITLSIHNPQ
jgi:hypothetical protein